MLRAVKSLARHRPDLCLDAYETEYTRGGESVFYRRDRVGPTSILIADSSYPYRGGLVVKALQKGAVYEITLSDQENTSNYRDVGADVRRVAALRRAVTEPV